VGRGADADQEHRHPVADEAERLGQQHHQREQAMRSMAFMRAS
jgi:hypothetical protein